MPQSRQCPKCSGSMAEGFIVDATHGSNGVSSWIEGAPEKSIWTGVNLSGRGRSEVASWRCGRCGFLEHYAAAPDRQHESAQSRQALLVVALVLAALGVVLAMVLALR